MICMKEWARLARNHMRFNTEKTRDIIDKYLDEHGMQMPTPLYVYDKHNIRTWKYLASKVTYNERLKTHKWIPVLNPEFAYGHLV